MLVTIWTIKESSFISQNNEKGYWISWVEQHKRNYGGIRYKSLDICGWGIVNPYLTYLYILLIDRTKNEKFFHSFLFFVFCFFWQKKKKERILILQGWIKNKIWLIIYVMLNVWLVGFSQVQIIIKKIDLCILWTNDLISINIKFIINSLLHIIWMRIKKKANKVKIEFISHFIVTRSICIRSMGHIIKGNVIKHWFIHN